MATLPGADVYLNAAVERARSQRKMTQTEWLISKANEVSIFDVLEDYFSHYAPRTGTSYKSRCPFGDEHADGGLDKGFRTYPDSNTSMCFPMHGYMPPVRLVQTKMGGTMQKAAQDILNRYGLLKPRNYRERFTEALAAREAYRDRIGDPQNAVAALQGALSRTTDYDTRQFDTDVVQAMERVLSVLDVVVSTNDPTKLTEWYQKSLIMLTKVIERKI